MAIIHFVLALCAVVLAASVDAGSPAVVEPAEKKAVPFDKRWIEPFFEKGAARQAVERFRLDDFSGAAKGFEAALKQLPASSPERLPARYMLALAKTNLGAWNDAGKLFEELYESYPRLAPWHAYHAARCRLRKGDSAGALAWSEKVPARTVPEAETILVRLDALAALMRWQQVADEAERFLDRFRQGPRRAEAQFHLGEAMEKLGRPAAEVVPVYRRIWAEAPLEPWARRAEDRISALAASRPAEERAAMEAPAAQDLFTRGMVLFERNQNGEAEATFAAALKATGSDPVLECRARYHRAQSVFKQRQRPRAVPFFAEAETACRAIGDKDLLVKSLYQGARCLATSGDVAGALAKYAAIEAGFPDHSYADDARLRQAELASEDNDEARALTLYSAIPSLYPRGDLLGEALFRVGFAAYRKGDDDKALAAFEENLSRIPREEIWYAEGRAHYWKARIFERMKLPESAKSAYLRAIREYPLSIYAFLSLERLRESFPDERAALVKALRAGFGKADKDMLPLELGPRPIYGDPGFLRAVELARMGLGSEARRELAFLGLKAPASRDAARGEKKPDSSQLDALWVTAVLLDRGRVFAASSAIPRYTLTEHRLAWPEGAGEAAWRLSYPRAFAELVEKQSRANKVPEALQWAIMREESAFDPRTESFANALGLTQMIVKTAQRFSPQKVTRDTLLDPASNVALGSKFLAFLLQHFAGAAPLTIAGYNAGEAAVDRWLKERGTLPLDEFLELIPYDETRNYTKRVMSSYLTYSWLYDAKTPVPPLSFTITPPAKARQGQAAPRRR